MKPNKEGEKFGELLGFNFLSLILAFSIPNQPVIPLHCFITKGIRTENLIKPGQWLHFVYTIYPVHVCLKFRPKSCSSCISFQADKSFWSCATQCFRPGKCCKEALSLHFSKPHISKFHTLTSLKRYTCCILMICTFQSLRTLFFSAHIIIRI